MKSELVNPGGVRSVISQAAGLLWDKNKTPQGPRGGARQAGNRIPDTQSREGLELLALSHEETFPASEKAHGGIKSSPSAAPVPTPTAQACYLPEAHPLTCIWAFPPPEPPGTKQHLPLGAVWVQPLSRAVPGGRLST